MQLCTLDELKTEALPGRGIKRVVGHNSMIPSEKMTISVCTYSKEFGPMAPHHHAEETIIILDCKNGWIDVGAATDELGDLPTRIDLKKGMVVHFDPLEWHVFRYKDDGFIVAACIYGQVDNIRPEDNKKAAK